MLCSGIICLGGDWMRPLKESVSITLDEDVVKKIKELAEEDNRSFSQYINMILRETIRRLESSEK